MGRDRDADRPEESGGTGRADDRRPDGQRRELGPDIHDDDRRVEASSRTEERGSRRVSEEHRGRETTGSRDGTESGQRITKEDIRPAAKEALIEREEELAEEEGDGLYGSSTDDPILGAALAELVGTFILVFGGTAVAVGAILNTPIAGGAYDSLAIALAFGLVLAAVVAATGHVSGGHVNPAVTLSLAATGKFPWKSVPFYIGAQLVGAVLGALGTWLAFGGPGRSEASLAATYPAQGVGDLQAFALEILVTFILVFVVVSVASDSRAPAAIAPIAVGFALAVGVFIAGPVTGGAVNPARALGPMIVNLDFTSVWLYILGPIIGGLLAAFLYDKTMAEG